MTSGPYIPVEKCNDPRCGECYPDYDQRTERELLLDTNKKVTEIHEFLFNLAQQMESLGSNPMVKALVGGSGLLPKLGGRNGKTQ